MYWNVLFSWSIGNIAYDMAPVLKYGCLDVQQFSCVSQSRIVTNLVTILSDLLMHKQHFTLDNNFIFQPVKR
jgi:hypothetical protein